MKQLILFFFLLLPFCLSSQVYETFDGTEIDSANPWRADSAGFFLKDGRLWFDASRRADGIHTIKLDIPYNVDSMEWIFDTSFSYKPTNNNNVRAFVYATGEPENVAYYVQVGNNEGSVSLYSWPSSDEKQIEIKGREGLLTKASNSVRVKLTLENNSKLTLYTRLEGESCFYKEGECKVVSSGKREGGVLNLQCRYQAVTKDNMLISFDNISVSDRITPTDLEPDLPDNPEQPDEDTKTLSVRDLEQENATELLMVFDDPVDPNRYQISLSEIGDVDEVHISDNEIVLKAVWYEARLKGKAYTLSYSGIFDKSGSEFKGDTTFVSAYGEDKQEPGSSGVLLINEIMADPNGLEELEKTEYIELYNASGKELSLNGWQLIYGKDKPKTIGNVSLPAAGYLVLYRSGRDLKVDKGGIAVSMDNFPSKLANAGKELQLWDGSGKVIDSITYAKATPGKSWERSSSGLHLSTDPRGGTPGSVNSSADSEEEEPSDDPDNPEEPEEPDTPIITDPVQPGEIIINELLPDPYVGGSEYIELYNRSDKPLSLSALSVATRKSDGTLSTRYPLASVSRNLKAKGYALLTKNREGVTSFYEVADPSALFQLAKLPVIVNTTSTLVLFRTADEVIIDELSYSSRWHSPFVKSQKGVALERINPDAPSQDPTNWSSASEVSGYGTPGYRNSQYMDASSGGSTGIEPPVWIEESGNYTVAYLLDRPGYSCRAFVFNTSGKRVAEIANHQLLGTSGEITWSGVANDGGHLQTGIYIFYAEIYHSEGTVKRFKKVFLIR